MSLPSMPRAQALLFTLLAMLAFAANSLLCRFALRETSIDAATFTSIRIGSGALVLWGIASWRSGPAQGSGSWLSAIALFGYAAGFSFAYLSLTAGTGALLLFGAVQVTMTGYGVWQGERLRLPQIAGLSIALSGLVILLFPGIAAPSPMGAALMILAGVAWGVYSLRGRRADDATRTTAGNFLRAVPLSTALSLLMVARLRADVPGILCAVASGALASGLGYTVWYAALRGLKATHAATVQLSVPVLAAAGGVIVLGERPGFRLAFAAVAILGGIALVIGERRRL